MVALPIAGGAELLRSTAVIIYESKSLGISTLQAELFARDSFLFGWISVTWITFLFSFGYWFVKDWTRNKYLIRKLEAEKEEINTKREERNSFKDALQAKRGQESYVVHISEVSYFEAMGDFVYAVDQTGKKHILNCTQS